MHQDDGFAHLFTGVTSERGRRAAVPRRFGRGPRPNPLLLVLAGAVFLLCLLTILADGGESPQDRSLARNLLVGVILTAWAAEIGWGGWPRLAFFALVVAAVAALMALGFDLFAPIILIATVGWATYNGTRREGDISLVLALGSLVPPLVIRWSNQGDWISWGLGIVFSWIAMRAVVDQRETLAELRTAQAEIARRSAAEERRRIARELHDVIAHSLAVTMLHLTGARHILGRDPRRAAEALELAERTGRQSLADMRRTVGLLAEESAAGGETAPPPPGAPDIPALIADYARAGLDIGLDARGDLGRPSPALGLDLYRIVQEAVANASKHAPGARVAVTLAITENEVALRIADTGPLADARAVVGAGETGAGPGRGLVGMRERVAGWGGQFNAGAADDGWAIACHIPLERR